MPLPRGQLERRRLGGRGCVTLLSLDEQLRVTQQTLQSREDRLRLAKRQFETGIPRALS